MKFVKTLFRKINWSIITLTTLSILAGCNDLQIQPEHKTIDAILSVKVNTSEIETKLTGQDFSDTTKINTIRSIDLIVFDYDSGAFEKHIRFGDAWNRISNMPSSTIITDNIFSINVSEGKKKIIVIANSQNTEKEIIEYYRDDVACTSVLYKEYPGLYTMYGMTTQEINVSGRTSVTIALSRLVSRIIINSIKVNYGDASFTDVYTINCCAKAIIGKNGIESNTILLWNKSDYRSSDNYEGRLIGDVITGHDYMKNNHTRYYIGEIKKGDTFSTPIYLYCYPMPTSPFIQKKMELIINAVFSHSRKYYPIVFNKVDSNTSYEIGSITLSSFGSDLCIYFLYTINAIPITKSSQGWNIAKIDNIFL
ncbi:MAG: fimbrial protein [Bacteroidales bacterium]|nr:fimbrial protein [Bacteroidales bacterium]